MCVAADVERVLGRVSRIGTIDGPYDCEVHQFGLPDAVFVAALGPSTAVNCGGLRDFGLAAGTLGVLVDVAHSSHGTGHFDTRRDDSRVDSDEEGGSRYVGK